MAKPKTQRIPKAGKQPGRWAGTEDSGSVQGVEGTNKTVPEPKPDAEPSAELQGTASKFIPKTPYSRG
jgi:hypothetical protein